jgi:hypothetical protein
MSKVIPIQRTKSDEQIIETLREILQKAEEGDVKAVAFCVVLRSTKTASVGWQGTVDRDALGYAISRLHFDFYDLSSDGEDEV